LIWDAVKRSKVVREGASEEDPIVRNVDENNEGEFTVCWNLLDGSSIVNNNWAVGTMGGKTSDTAPTLQPCPSRKEPSSPMLFS
jgi:sedoheptulose-bisphosphatase